MQLTLFFSIDSKKERVIHSKSVNIKFTSDNDANEVVNELFDSLTSRYQSNLETSMRGNDFVFESVQYYKYGGSYNDSPGWIKKKKATTNPKITDDKCFQYVVTVALNYGKIK